MAITYNSSTNTIIVTGYTEESPCTFEDIYQADVSNGWGVVNKQGDNQYLFDCRLQIGDGVNETWFADSLKQITFTATSTSGSNQKLFDIKENAYFRLGVCTSDEDKTTEDGCSLSYLGTDNPFFIYSDVPVEIYSCIFSSPNGYAQIRTLSSNSKIYNTIFNKGIYLSNAKGIFHNIVIQHSPYGITNPTIEEGSDKIRIEDVSFGFFIKEGGIFRNIEILQSSYDIRVFFLSVDSYLINIKCGWNIQWLGSSTGKLYRQYTFNLKVIDKAGNPISNAKVRMYDKDGNLVFEETTDANGQIPEQIITRGYYDQAHGNELVDFAPLTLEIQKQGYQIYRQIFTPKSPINWIVRLKHENINVDEEVLL